MASLILDLFINGLYSLSGNYLFVGVIIVFVFAIFLSAIGLSGLSVLVIELGLIGGLTQAGWLPVWVKGIFMVLMGVIFFYTLYQVFRT